MAQIFGRFTNGSIESRNVVDIFELIPIRVPFVGRSTVVRFPLRSEHLRLGSTSHNLNWCQRCSDWLIDWLTLLCSPRSWNWTESPQRPQTVAPLESLFVNTFRIDERTSGIKRSESREWLGVADDPFQMRSAQTTQLEKLIKMIKVISLRFEFQTHSSFLDLFRRFALRCTIWNFCQNGKRETGKNRFN
jgi:hypothetical protein